MDQEIKIIISAEDDYTAAMEKAKGAIKGLGLSGEAETARLGNQLDRLTSAADYAAGGIKRIRSMIEGMAFGGAIGLVSGLVSAFTGALIEHVKESIVTEEKVRALKTSVEGQAKAWHLLPEPINKATEATIGLYNAQLQQLQLAEKDKGDVLRKQIENLEGMKDVMARKQGLPFWVGYTAVEIEGLNVRIFKAKKELEDWNTLMGLTPTTMEKIAEAAKKTTIEVGAIFSGGLLTGGGMLRELEKSPLERLMGAGEGVTFDVNAKLQPWMLYYEGLIGLEHGLTSETDKEAQKRAQIEKQTQDTITGMKFAAGNAAAALLNTIGRHSKAAAMAALALQKGLAIGQVYVSTGAAAMRALAELGPTAGPPMAATIWSWGKATMALIAAQGIAEATMGGGGPSGVGGGGGVGALPIESPAVVGPSMQEAAPVKHITIIIQNPLNGEIADSAAEAIIDLINRGGGMNYKIDARVIEA